MYEAMIRLENLDDAKAFVNICNDMNFKVELLSGPYIIDAKSIMGLFSLDMSHPIKMRAHCPETDDFQVKIHPFLAETAQ